MSVFHLGPKFLIFFLTQILKLVSQNSLSGLTPGVTTSHEFMKYTKYDKLSWGWGFVTYPIPIFLSIYEKSFKYSLWRSLSSINFLSLKNNSTSSSSSNAGLAREFWNPKSKFFIKKIIFNLSIMFNVYKTFLFVQSSEINFRKMPKVSYLLERA